MIPKIIHYCWLGGKPLTPLAKKCVESWQRLMPDYEIKCWDESNYDFRKNKFMANAYKQKMWGFVTDYARLDIIYNYGGIYFDTDVEALKPFDEFLKYPSFCGFESKHFINFGHGFGAEKGNLIIKKIMEPYENINFKIDENILKQVSLYSKINIEDCYKQNTVPCPIIQTQILTKNYGLKQDNTRQTLDGMEVFPSSYFAPKNKANLPLKTADAYSVHWYAASWQPFHKRLYLKIKKVLSKILGKNYTRIYNIKKKIFK